MTDDSEKFEQMTCPDNVNWTDDIKQMFTQTDIDCMKPMGVDLSSYQDTSTNADIDNLLAAALDSVQGSILRSTYWDSWQLHQN